MALGVAPSRRVKVEKRGAGVERQATEPGPALVLVENIDGVLRRGPRIVRRNVLIAMVYIVGPRGEFVVGLGGQIDGCLHLWGRDSEASLRAVRGVSHEKSCSQFWGVERRDESGMGHGI